MWCSSRLTVLVAMGSLCEARRKASQAVSFPTPAISKSIRPGLTTATHRSMAALPPPWRTSKGFLETGLSGKMRIQIWPPRRRWRVMARRAASILACGYPRGLQGLHPEITELELVGRVG